MEIVQAPFEKYIFVCENERPQGKCCAPEGKTIREKLKSIIAELGLKKRIRVSRTVCLDVCSQGPNVLIMPDNRWFKGVGMDDLDEIIKNAEAK